MNKNMRTCKSISAIIPLGTVTWYTLDNKTMKWKGSIGKRESARGSKVLKHFSQVLLQRMEKTGGKLRTHIANGGWKLFLTIFIGGSIRLSIRRCFRPAKETLTSSCELEGKLWQRFQIRFSFEFISTVSTVVSTTSNKFFFCCKIRNSYSGIVAESV